MNHFMSLPRQQAAFYKEINDRVALAPERNTSEQMNFLTTLQKEAIRKEIEDKKNWKKTYLAHLDD